MAAQTTSRLCWAIGLLTITSSLALASSRIKMEGMPKQEDPMESNHIEFPVEDLTDRGSKLERDAEIASCRPEFRTFPGHTMCLPDHPDSRNFGVTKQDQILIVKLHNDVRANVQPPAASMQRMIWDNRLAEIARKWARVCQPRHDKERTIPGFRASVGQNVAGSTANIGWRAAVSLWSNEVKDFTFGQGKTGPGPIGHYTQMVKAATSRIGCGYADCPNLEYRHRYVCNYSPGQLYSDQRTPYIAGPRCSDCGRFCSDGLCDCGGLVCENHSDMNASRCACSCPTRFSGRDCATSKCFMDDNPLYCRRRDFSDCKRFYNIPQECPHFCGLCEGETAQPTARPIEGVFTTVVTTQIFTTVNPESPETSAPNATDDCSEPGSCYMSDLFIRGRVANADKALILQIHNRIKSKFKSTLKLPAMVWDKMLELKAQRWAQKCQPLSDPSLKQPENKDRIWQMRRFGTRTWSKTLAKWRKDERLRNIIKAGNDRIGCGFALCNHRRKRFYFCNYRKSQKSNTVLPGDHDVTGEKNMTNDVPIPTPTFDERNMTNDLPIPTPTSDERNMTNDLPIPTPTFDERNMTNDLPIPTPTFDERNMTNGLPIPTPTFDERNMTNGLPIPTPTFGERNTTNDVPMPSPTFGERNLTNDVPIPTPTPGCPRDMKLCQLFKPPDCWLYGLSNICPHLCGKC